MNRQLLKVTFLLCLSTVLAFAQKGQGGQAGQQGGQGGAGSQSTQTGQAGGAGQGLPGLSFSPSEWPLLGLPDVKSSALSFPGRAVLCYRLAQANNSTQPFVLERLTPDEFEGSGFYRPCGDRGDGETDSEGKKACKADLRLAPEKRTFHWTACTESKSPLTMGQVMVLGIDVSDLGPAGLNIDQLKLLNINLTNQQGGPINPSPVRPSFPSTSSTGAGGGSAGSPGVMEDASGKGVLWIPLGNHTPQGSNPAPWHECKAYRQGSVVSDASGRSFYRLQIGHLSREELRKINSATAEVCSKFHPEAGKLQADAGSVLSGLTPRDPFPPQPRVQRILDGEVIWQEMNPPALADLNAGDYCSSTGPRGQACAWRDSWPFREGDIACVQRGTARDSVRDYELELKLNMVVRSAKSADPVRSAASINREMLDIIAAAPAAAGSSKVETCGKKQTEVDAYNDQVKAGLIANGELGHLHYYRAVRGGKAGRIPLDPISINLIPRTIYLTWPYQLPGDVIPTFSINLLYSPPVPGAVWVGNTFYPAGSVVTSAANRGHFYTALTGGISTSEPKEPTFPVDAPPTFIDGSLVWLDSGTSQPSVSAAAGQSSGGGQGAGGGGGGGGGQAATTGQGNPSAGKSQLWLAGSHYSLGDVILDPYSGHYFTMVRSAGGMSGKAPSSNPGTGGQQQPGPSDPFPPLVAQSPSLRDGDLVLAQVVGAPPSTPSRWQPTLYNSGQPVENTKIALGQVIALGQQGGAPFYFVAALTATSGKSGDPFNTNATTFTDNQLTWTQCVTSPRSTCDTGGLIASWQANHSYALNVIVRGNNGLFYKVTGVPQNTQSGLSGSAPSPFAGAQPALGTPVPDYDLLWNDIGPAPATLAAPGWVGGTSYSVGDSVTAGGRTYVVVRTLRGSTGSSMPVVTTVGSLVSVADGDLVWMDIGTDAPGQSNILQWQAYHDYRMNDVVQAGNRRYYRVVTIVGGTSGPAPRSPFPVRFNEWSPNSVSDGSIVWVKWNKPERPDNPQYWSPDKLYSKDSQVVGRDDVAPGASLALADLSAVTWVATNAGRSGPTPAQPLFPIVEPKTVVDGPTLICEQYTKTENVIVGNPGECPPKRVLWADAGVSRPLGSLGNISWKPNVPYNVGDVVFAPTIGGGRYFRALGEPATSGDASPFLSSSLKLPPTLPITWIDSGTTPPALVSSGQPADQNIGLSNLALPQVHSLSYFNIATGFVYNFQKFPSFSYSAVPHGAPAGDTLFSAGTQSAPAILDATNGCTYNGSYSTSAAAPTIANSNGGFCPGAAGKTAAGVDAVLAFTLYFPPVDAERALRKPWSSGLRDYIPAPSFAGSLINPTTSFYVGFSNELGLRNLQLFYGFSFQKVATGLGNPASQPVYTGTGTLPAISTSQGFHSGKFAGITLNLTGFIQSLFPGGGTGAKP